MSETWICPSCGAENTGNGKFCLTCGGLRYANAAETAPEEEPEEILDFAALKQRREPHGKLYSVSYSFRANGMMANSHEESEVTLKRLESEEAELLIRNESGLNGGEKNVYRVPTSILSELAEIAERENLPAWSELKYDPDPRYMPTDYSSSSHFSLVYDSVDPGNPRQEYFSIDIAAVPKEGTEVISGMIDRMRAAAENREALSHEEIPPKPMAGLMGIMGMKEALEYQKKQTAGATEPGTEKKLVFDAQGYWICPECGEHNPGKFCAGCGTRRPEA